MGQAAAKHSLLQCVSMLRPRGEGAPGITQTDRGLSHRRSVRACRLYPERRQPLSGYRSAANSRSHWTNRLGNRVRTGPQRQSPGRATSGSMLLIGNQVSLLGLAWSDVNLTFSPTALERFLIAPTALESTAQWFFVRPAFLPIKNVLTTMRDAHIYCFSCTYAALRDWKGHEVGELKELV